MRRDGLYLSRRHQAWLHGVSAALFGTGAAWLVFHHFLHVPGEFGDQPHALEAWWLKLHGGLAMAFLVLLGTLVRGHIPAGWRSRRNRVSGIGLVSVNLLLIATGWALYYLGTESVRPLLSAAHWGIGVVLPFGLLWHARAGLRTRLVRARGGLDRNASREGREGRPLSAATPSPVRAGPAMADEVPPRARDPHQGLGIRRPSSGAARAK